MAGYIHLEADMYFESSAGYRFDPLKLKDAHDWCLTEASTRLKGGFSVVVANTFVTQSEMERYFRLGYPTLVVQALGNWPSLHRVDAAILQRMRESWETLDLTQPFVYHEQ